MPQSEAGKVEEVAAWKINGFPAVVLVWSPPVWAALPEGQRPRDVAELPSGLRVALRME